MNENALLINHKKKFITLSAESTQILLRIIFQLKSIFKITFAYPACYAISSFKYLPYESDY